MLIVECVAPVVLDSAGASRPAAALSLPREKLLQLAGLAAAPRGRLKEESLRFTARSEPVTSLSREESQALELFVKFLVEA